MTDWFPDWGDGGCRVFRITREGIRVEGAIEIDEQFSGEDEIPLPSVRIDDGTQESFFDYEWQRVEEEQK